jgi:hypothetical protein
MSTINTGALGAVNSVTYTSLDGLNLSASQITDTTSKVQTASTIAGSFQQAVNALLYQNLDGCSLNELFNANSTPTLAQVTAFLQTNLNASVNPNQMLSIDDLKTLKKALDGYANQEASKLPGNSGGGIKSVNGSFYVNGQEVTIQDVFMAVRVNQLANFEDQINAYMSELQKNNDLAKAANAWITTLNNLTPTNTTDSITTACFLSAQEAFYSQYHYDPVARFMPTSASGAGTTNVGGVTYAELPTAISTKISAYVTDAKNYVTNINSENQTAQTYLDQLNNKRSEVLDSITNFTKSEGQVQQDMSSKL